MKNRRGVIYHALNRYTWILIVALLLLLPLGFTRAQSQPLADTTIVLDPGHGGDDWGVDPAGSGLREKEVVVDISRRLKALLEADGATVFITRDSDRFVSLPARVRYSNALLFRPDNQSDHGRLISVHINSNRNQPNLRRVEVLVDPRPSRPTPSPRTWPAICWRRPAAPWAIVTRAIPTACIPRMSLPCAGRIRVASTC